MSYTKSKTYFNQHQDSDIPRILFSGRHYPQITSNLAFRGIIPRGKTSSSTSSSSAPLPLILVNDAASTTSHGYEESHAPVSEVWKKIQEERNKHAKFLAKIDATESRALHARLVNPSIVGLKLEMSTTDTTAPPEQFKGGDKLEARAYQHEVKEPPKNLMVGGIPWQKKEGYNPEQERQNVFGLFKMTGGSVPETPRLSSEDKLILKQKKTKKNKKGNQQQNVEFGATESLFRYEKGTVPSTPLPEGLQKVTKSPFSHVSPRVDTGLTTTRKTTEKYTRDGVPIIDRPHHPLTIGSRLPKNFNTKVHMPYDNFKSQRAKQIDEVTARLYPGPLPVQLIHKASAPKNKGAVPNTNPTTTTTGIKIPPVINIKNLPPVEHRTIGNYGTYGSYYNHHSGQIETLLQAPKYPTNLDDPQMSAISFRQDFIMESSNRKLGFGAYNKRGSNGKTHFQDVVNKQNAQQRENNDLQAGKQQQQRRYRPVQLLPLHVPGPKHDNIYITKYKGGDSDGEKESDDDMATIAPPPPAPGTPYLSKGVIPEAITSRPSTAASKSVRNVRKGKTKN